MLRTAVFIDAGYLFAGGATAISGSARPRPSLRLNETAVISELRELAVAKSEGGNFLRIYWYDAPPPGGRPGAHHTTLAFSDHLKLRLGVLNSSGQQKGVDSLIVTDLIELARNRAITDALLLSGDEDVRIGVTIAQSFGVRVHLLGIEPIRSSISDLLMQEADTTTEWSADVVRRFLDYDPSDNRPIRPSEGADAVKGDDPTLESTVVDYVNRLTAGDIAALQTFWASNDGLPSDYDRPLLGRCKAVMARRLEARETTWMRKRFIELVRLRIAGVD